RCAHWERFLAHTAGPFPPTLPTAATIAIRTPPLPPSPGETLRPRGFSHRRGDAKSLVYWTKRLRRGMGGAGCVVAPTGRLSLLWFWSDILGISGRRGWNCLAPTHERVSRCQNSVSV